MFLLLKGVEMVQCPQGMLLKIHLCSCCRLDPQISSEPGWDLEMLRNTSPIVLLHLKANAMAFTARKRRMATSHRRQPVSRDYNNRREHARSIFMLLMGAQKSFLIPAISFLRCMLSDGDVVFARDRR